LSDLLMKNAFYIFRLLESYVPNYLANMGGARGDL